jgi:thioredoxin-related protein
MRNKMLLSGLLAIIAILVFAFIPKDSKEKNKESNNGATEQGIQFIEADWSKALTEAKKQHKLIFLDAYASWCGPCKLLKKKTFPDKAAGDFFNANYINIAIDMEKGDGPSLGEKYAVNAYPTLIITDADGNIVTYTQGYISPKQLIDFGEYGLKQKKK